MIEKRFCNGVAGAVADYLFQELKLDPRRGDYRVISATSGPRVLTLGRNNQTAGKNQRGHQPNRNKN